VKAGLLLSLGRRSAITRLFCSIIFVGGGGEEGRVAKHVYTLSWSKGGRASAVIFFLSLFAQKKEMSVFGRADM